MISVWNLIWIIPLSALAGLGLLAMLMAAAAPDEDKKDDKA